MTTGRLLRKKVLLLGEIGVGKTSLVRRLTLGLLPTDYKPTSGVSIYSYRCPVPTPDGRERMIEFAIWDTDGMLGDGIFRHEYSEGAAGALIIGDVERQSTLLHVVDLAHKFQAAMPSRSFRLVVNKADRSPDRDERALPAPLREERTKPLWTSALTGEGVEPAFVAAGREILRREP